MNIFEQVDKVLEIIGRHDLHPAFAIEIGATLTAMADGKEPTSGVKRGIELCLDYARKTGRQESEIVAAYLKTLQEASGLFNVDLKIVHVRGGDPARQPDDAIRGEAEEELRKAMARFTALLN